MCYLYKMFGIKVLLKFCGRFVFVVFDFKSVCVFVVWDVSGEYELKYIRDDDGIVIVVNFDGASELLLSKCLMSEVFFGCYIYGYWSISLNCFVKMIVEKSLEFVVVVVVVERAFRGFNVKSRRFFNVMVCLSVDGWLFVDFECEEVFCDDWKCVFEDLDGGYEYEFYERV